MQFSENDLKFYKSFKSVIEKSKIEIQGEAVVIAASLFNWFNGLEKRIEESIKENKIETPIIPKEKKDVVKKL